jgi:putative peptidoglycan lipid II flippase
VLVPFLGHTGLALSVGLGACLNAALLWIGLHRRGAIAAGFGWTKYLFQLAIALIPLSLLLHYGANLHQWIAMQSEPWTRIGLLAAWILGAAVVYFTALWIVGIRWQHFRRHAK